MSWTYLWSLVQRAGFHPLWIIYQARIDVLRSLSHEFERHDFFSEARKVDSYIKTEPKP